MTLETELPLLDKLVRENVCSLRIRWHTLSSKGSGDWEANIYTYDENFAYGEGETPVLALQAAIEMMLRNRAYPKKPYDPQAKRQASAQRQAPATLEDIA